MQDNYNLENCFSCTHLRECSNDLPIFSGHSWWGHRKSIERGKQLYNLITPTTQCCLGNIAPTVVLPSSSPCLVFSVYVYISPGLLWSALCVDIGSRLLSVCCSWQDNISQVGSSVTMVTYSTQNHTYKFGRWLALFQGPCPIFILVHPPTLVDDKTVLWDVSPLDLT